MPVSVSPLDNSTSQTWAAGSVIPEAKTGRQPERVATSVPTVTASIGISPTAVRTNVPATKHEWSLIFMGLSRPISAALESQL